MLRISPRVGAFVGGLTSGTAAGAATLTYAHAERSPQRKSTITQSVVYGTLAVGVLGVLASRLAGGATLAAASVGAGMSLMLSPAAIPLNQRWRPHDDAAEAARMVAAAHTHLARASEWFAERGVRGDEGTGPINVEYRRDYYNAGFRSGADGGLASIRVGRSYVTGESFAEMDDVMYHEFAHRVIDGVAPGVQRQRKGEPAAVAEGIADAFAVALDDDWQLAERAGRGMTRDLQDPHRFSVRGIRYPKHASEYTARGDHHVNSTIVGHASYLIAQTLGRQAMGELMLRALRQHGEDGPPLSIADLARLVTSTAETQYGPSSEQARAVAQAWQSVGYRT